MDNDQMQLSFSLADQEQNAQGCGLPRKLVERMPVTLGGFPSEFKRWPTSGGVVVALGVGRWFIV